MSTIVCSCCICSIGICSIICSTNSCCAKSCEPNRAIRCCIISPPVYCNATYRNSCSIPSRFKSSSRTCIKKVRINIVWSINNQIKSIASSITVKDITLNHIGRTEYICISTTICGAVINVSNIRWVIKFNMTQPKSFVTYNYINVLTTTIARNSIIKYLSTTIGCTIIPRVFCL